MTPIHNRYLAPTWALLCAAVLTFAGCGGAGKDKGADEPAMSDDDLADDDTAPEDTGDDLIPPEKFDEIQRFFDRKAKFVSRCFTDAIEANEVPRRSSGRATVMMTIDTKGRPTNVRVTKIQPQSNVLEQCIIKDVSSWTITELPEKLDYSYTFGFGTL